DHRLVAAGEVRAPRVVDVAAVAGADPAVAQRRRRRLRILQVAEHRHRVPEAQLAVLVRAKAVEVRVEDPDLGASERTADVARPELASVAGIAADADERLGHPPDHAQLDTEAFAEG